MSYWHLLLARVGVGVGEGGTNPPSHSMIADLYPVECRSTAMAIFATGPCLGILLGFMVGGWVGQILGWRAIRSHGMSVSAAGTAVALTMGIVGGGGTLVRGLLADRIGKHNAAWRLRIVAIACLAAIPIWLAMLVEADSAATLALLVPCGALLAFYLGPTFAMVQSLADPRMRAVAAALLQLVMSLVGLGLGPVAIGVLSDSLQTAQGSDSLRLALFIVPAVYLWSAYHYEAAARTIAADLRSATELARVARAA